MADITCAICGKLFETRIGNAKYCGKECRAVANKASCAASHQRRKERQANHTPVKKVFRDKLSEVVSEARQNGMSYGQWMAQNR